MRKLGPRDHLPATEKQEQLPRSLNFYQLNFVTVVMVYGVSLKVAGAECHVCPGRCMRYVPSAV